jgi:hypothetical protein
MVQQDYYVMVAVIKDRYTGMEFVTVEFSFN